MWLFRDDEPLHRHATTHECLIGSGGHDSLVCLQWRAYRSAGNYATSRPQRLPVKHE